MLMRYMMAVLRNKGPTNIPTKKCASYQKYYCSSHSGLISERPKINTYLERNYNFFQTSHHYKPLLSTDLPSNSLLSKAVDLLKNWSEKAGRQPSSYFDDKFLLTVLKQCTSNQEVLLLANAWLGTLLQAHLNVNNYPFYQQLIISANDRWIDSCNNHHELILWSFLLCRGKSSMESNRGQKKIFERFKANDASLFQQLDIQQVGIFCNGLFAADVSLLSRAMSAHLLNLLQVEMRRSQLAHPEVIPILKLLRMAGFYIEHLMSDVMAALLDSSAQQLNLAQAAHALALLAEHRYGPAGQQLLDNMLCVIKSDRCRLPDNPEKYIHPTLGARVKDFARAIWALTSLAPSSPTAQLIANEMVQQLEQAWDRGHLRDPDSCHHLADIFLSLACWNIYPENLIKKTVDQSFIDHVVSGRDSIAYRKRYTVRQSRLALFLVAAGIEAPHLELPDAFSRAVTAFRNPQFPQRTVKTREPLLRLADTVRDHAAILGWTNVNYCSIIPYLNIAGLVFNYKG